MTKHILLSLAVALGLAAVAAPARAQEGPKLYVFSSGSLGGFPKAALQMGGQGNIDWAPVSFYRPRRMVGTAGQGLRSQDDEG
jgi:hypothetical protein